MESTTNKTASNILVEAKVKIEILKENLDSYTAHEQLRIASAVKNHVVDDLTVINTCGNDAQLLAERDSLIDEINEFQKTIILDVVNSHSRSVAIGNAIVEDFNSAKDSLLKLVSAEQQSIADNDSDINWISENINEYAHHINTLSNVEESCEETKYTILMLGEYQSGKTTTLNALCGGHAVGAIGNGIATSSVLLTVSYADKEDVKLEWKSKEQLLDILTHLGAYFDSFKIEEFDIDNIEHRDYWLQKLEGYRRDGDISDVAYQHLRFLILSSFILRFYGSDDIERLKNKQIRLIDIPTITRFPKLMDSRWKQNGTSAFAFEESAFVFIEQVNYYCPSTILKDLNSTIIDCPGLFQNDYDTSITVKAMVNASAIMYVLPHEKEIKQDMRESLIKIKKSFTDLHRKLVMAQNFETMKHTDFLESNEQTIKNLFGENTTITRYDAYLAYLGGVKNLYDRDELSEDEKTRFVNSLNRIIRKRAEMFNRGLFTGQKHETKQFSNFMDAWNYRFKSYKDDVPKDKILEISNLNDLKDKIKLFASTNKIFSIIIDKGINKLTNELYDVRDKLTLLYIEPYLENREQQIEKWDNRMNLADEFSKDAAIIVHNRLFEKKEEKGLLLINRLSCKIYEKLFTDDIYSQMIKNLADIIFENKMKIYKLRKKENELKEFIMPLITTSITSIIESRLNYWYSLIESSQDETFADIFIPASRELKQELEQRWNESYSNDAIMKDKMTMYFSIPQNIKRNNIQNITNEMTITVNHNDVGSALATEIVVVATGIALAVASYICFLISSAVASAAFTVSNPLGLFIGMILLLGGSLGMLFGGTEKVKEHFTKKFSEKIKEEFKDKDVYSIFRNLIYIEVKNILLDYESSFTLNKILMKNDRDIIISKSMESVDEDCFKAVNAITFIDQQLDKYSEFNDCYVKYESN